MSVMGTEAKLTTMLLVAVVGLSAVAGAGAGGQMSALDAHNETTNATNPADVAHISDDGETVLEYRSAGNDTGGVAETEFGVDVATGLANALLVSEANTSGASGNLSAVLTPDNVSAAAAGSIAETENLTALDLSANLTRTDAESSFDASLLASTDTSVQAPGSLETNGSVAVSADAFRMDAALSSSDPVLPIQQVASDVTIEGTDTGYVVSVEEVRPGANETRYGNESATNRTLSAQFGAVADQFNGSSVVTIHAHSYDNETGVLAVNYTATLAGVNDGIARTVVEGMTNDSAIELTAEERATLVGAVANVSVDEISVGQNRSGEVNTAAASVRLSNYQEAVVAFMQVSADRNTTGLSPAVVDRYRDTVNASRAADLVQETTWDVTVNGSENATHAEATVTYDSQNWSAYVTELSDRGIEQSTNVTASLSGELSDGGIDVSGEFEVQRADLVGDALGALQGGSDDTQATELLGALRDSEFRTARAGVDLGQGTLTLQAGGQFENVSALGNATAGLFGGTSVAQIHGQGDANGTSTYVHLAGTHTVSGLENMGLVDNETQVNEGANVSQLPAMNTTAAAQYAGVTLPSDGDGDGGTSTPTSTPTDGGTPTPTLTDGGDDAETVSPGQPGFGAVVAVLAVVLAGLLVRRRR